ncbi:MAG: hypothetical protein NXI10_14805 [bacterium]|nr:hypothetical protein [bacterium]
MKRLFLIGALLLSFGDTLAQAPTLLLDGLPSGSVYTDSPGVLTVSPASDYMVLKFSVAIRTKYRKKFYIPPNSTQLGPLMRKLPSGAEVSIWATIGCQGCEGMQISSVYFIP